MEYFTPYERILEEVRAAVRETANLTENTSEPDCWDDIPLCVLEIGDTLGQVEWLELWEKICRIATSIGVTLTQPTIEEASELTILDITDKLHDAMLPETTH